MSEETFKYSGSSLIELTIMVEDMSANARNLTPIVREKTDGQIGGWSRESSSRQVQIAPDQRLGSRTGSLTQALDKVANALGDIKDLTHDTEVRNVVVID